MVAVGGGDEPQPGIVRRLAEQPPAGAARWIGVGFLGGFTTFSTFAVQMVLEADGGKPGLALLYGAVTVLGGLAAAVAGYLVGRALT